MGGGPRCAPTRACRGTTRTYVACQEAKVAAFYALNSAPITVESVSAGTCLGLAHQCTVCRPTLARGNGAPRTKLRNCLQL